MYIAIGSYLVREASIYSRLEQLPQLHTGGFFSLLMAKLAQGALYATNGKDGDPSQLFEVDLDTNTVDVVGDITVDGSPVTINAMAFDDTTNTMYAHTCSKSGDPAGSLIELDVITAEGTQVGGDTALKGGSIDFAFNSLGNLYAWDMETGLVRIDKLTGVVTKLDPVNFPKPAYHLNLAFDDNDNLHAVCSPTEDNVFEYHKLNPIDGECTPVNTLNLPEEFAHGDIKPGTMDLYTAEKFCRDSEDILVLNLAGECKVKTGDPIKTGIKDVHVLAFTSSECFETERCTTLFGHSGMRMHKRFLGGLFCANWCICGTQEAVRMARGWECGEC